LGALTSPANDSRQGGQRRNEKKRRDSGPAKRKSRKPGYNPIRKSRHSPSHVDGVRLSLISGSPPWHGSHPGFQTQASSQPSPPPACGRTSTDNFSVNCSRRKRSPPGCPPSAARDRRGGFLYSRKADRRHQPSFSPTFRQRFRQHANSSLPYPRVQRGPAIMGLRHREVFWRAGAIGSAMGSGLLWAGAWDRFSAVLSAWLSCTCASVARARSLAEDKRS